MEFFAGMCDRDHNFGTPSSYDSRSRGKANLDLRPVPGKRNVGRNYATIVLQISLTVMYIPSSTTTAERYKATF